MPVDFDILRLSASLLRYAGARQAMVARNIAHADTPGYQARDAIPFADLMRRAGGPHFEPRMSRPGHGVAADGGTRILSRPLEGQGSVTPNGNTVSLEDQMIRAADLRRQHTLAAGVYRKSMEIFRLGLGRQR